MMILGRGIKKKVDKSRITQEKQWILSMHIPEIRHTGAPIHHIRDKAFELVLEMMSKYKTWGATLWGILAIKTCKNEGSSTQRCAWV